MPTASKTNLADNVVATLSGKIITITIDLDKTEPWVSGSGKSMLYATGSGALPTQYGDIRISLNAFRTIPKADRKG